MKEKSNLQLLALALTTLEEMLDSPVATLDHEIVLSEERSTQETASAHEALESLLKTLKSKVPKDLARRVAMERKFFSNEEDDRHRLNPQSQAVLYAAELYNYSNVVRLYK